MPCKYLVLGAQLVCTKAKDSEEVSLLMACADNINNALLAGSKPAANRKNREVDKDIIPFTECQKKSGFLGLDGNDPCKTLIETAPLWENLTLPFDEVKVPNINWVPIFSWNKAVDLNHASDEKQFRSNYYAAKNSNNGNYKFSDHELRRNANLQIYTDSTASEDASLTMDSILLCLGYGGIIRPKTDGQSPLDSELFELALSLPADQISEEAYAELARLFLYELNDSQKADFMSLCFDFDHRSDPNLLQSFFTGTVQDADIWKANQDKFNKILEYMNIFASLECAALKDLGDPDQMQQYLDTLHNLFLFDSAQYISPAASEIGASGPYISLQRQTEALPPYEYNGKTYNWEVNSYVLDYKKYELYTVENTLNGTTASKILEGFNNPYSGNYVPQGYMMFSHSVTVYSPAQGSDITQLMNLLNQKSYDQLAPSPYGGVPGAVRDEAISIVVDLAGDAVPTLASHGIGLVTAGYDIAADINEAQQQSRIISQITDINNFLTACDDENWAGGVAIFSDNGKSPIVRPYPSTP